MVEIGFKSLKSDPCVYIYSEGGAIYVLTLYVDDVLLLGKDCKVLERIKRKLMGRFSMTDMGDVLLMFGMEVTRDRKKGTVTITQENYVKFLLERYGGVQRLGRAGIRRFRPRGGHLKSPFRG